MAIIKILIESPSNTELLELQKFLQLVQTKHVSIPRVFFPKKEVIPRVARIWKPRRTPEEMAEWEKQKTARRKAAQTGGRWSKNFDNCVRCHTTEIKHMGKGLCKSCYVKSYMRSVTVTKEEHIKMAVLTGRKVCHNPQCVYSPADYTEEEMIQKDGNWYCSQYCYTEERK